MNDTPTPRVDAQADHAGNFHNLASVVDANLARDLERQLAEATREIEVLRRYGNKDCTAMADEELASIRQPLPNPPTL